MPQQPPPQPVYNPSMHEPVRRVFDAMQRLQTPNRRKELAEELCLHPERFDRFLLDVREMLSGIQNEMSQTFAIRKAFAGVSDATGPTERGAYAVACAVTELLADRDVRRARERECAEREAAEMADD